mmetsp:Transcript_4779/g.16657  ORF Transcript_4779/g.16657 Transcript_4779/m.16657 type:complete len:256 (+) Transcript_4779:1062-1829(+)
MRRDRGQPLQGGRLPGPQQEKRQGAVRGPGSAPRGGYARPRLPARPALPLRVARGGVQREDQVGQVLLLLHGGGPRQGQGRADGPPAMPHPLQGRHEGHHQAHHQARARRPRRGLLDPRGLPHGDGHLRRGLLPEPRRALLRGDEQQPGQARPGGHRRLLRQADRLAHHQVRPRGLQGDGVGRGADHQGVRHDHREHLLRAAVQRDCRRGGAGRPGARCERHGAGERRQRADQGGQRGDRGRQPAPAPLRAAGSH